MKYYPYNLPVAASLLEVVDNDDRPMLLLNANYAKNFSHRRIVLILKGRYGKVLLFRHARDCSKWGLPMCAVSAGQARQDAAYALLQGKLKELGISNQKLSCEDCIENAHTVSGAGICQNSSAKNEQVEQSWVDFTTFFVISLQVSKELFAHKQLLWLDLDELRGLSIHSKEMLSSKTLMLVEQGYINKII